MKIRAFGDCRTATTLVCKSDVVLGIGKMKESEAWGKNGHSEGAFQGDCVRVIGIVAAA